MPFEQHEDRFAPPALKPYVSGLGAAARDEKVRRIMVQERRRLRVRSQCPEI